MIVVGLIGALQPDRELIGDVDIAADLSGPFLIAGVIGYDACDLAPALLVFETANHMRHVVLDGDVHVGVGIAAFFERDDGREAVSALEGVADEVGAITASEDHVVADDVAQIAGEGNESRFIQTDTQAAKLDIGITQRGAGGAAIVVVGLAVSVAVPVIAQFAIGLERAEFRFGSGGETQADAGQLVPSVALQLCRGASIVVVAAACIIANIAMNAQAGFRSRNVEIASAVCIAYADIFDCFGFRRHDCIGCLRAGNRYERCSRTKKNFSDSHKMRLQWKI